MLESLKTLSQYYEIYIFTTLSQKIASKIIWILDPEKKIFKGIIRREYCYKTQDNILIKDLRIIKNKNLKDLVIINSNCNSFVSQIDNAIPLLPWYGDLEDSELIYLTKYLFYLSKCDDVRDKNKEYFKLLQLSSKTLQDFYFL